MQRTSFLSLAGSVVVLLHCAVGSATVQCDVVIIGGGAAGANGAIFLKRKGYAVCLIEKDVNLGGHCDTLYFEGAPPGAPDYVDLGVLVYTQSRIGGSLVGSFTLDTKAYIDSLTDSVLVNFAGTSTASNPVDLQKGINVPSTNIPTATPDPSAIGTAIQALFGIVSGYPWLDGGDFPDPIPPELLVPFSTFITTHGLEVLIPNVFQSLLAQGGMGSINKLTTLYALKNLRSGILSLALGITDGIIVQNGCQSLYDSIQGELEDGGKVYTSATVNSVQRPAAGSKGKSTIKITDASGNNVMLKADSIIFAAPQTPANIAILGPDAKETAAFNDVITRQYFALVYDVSGGSLAAQSISVRNFDTSLQGTGTLLPAAPSLFGLSRILPYGPTVGEACADTDRRVSQTEMENIAKGLLDKLPSELIEDITLIDIDEHVFQPHFSAAALARSPSPYTVIKNLQGYRNTYYAGALVSYAESSSVMDKTYKLVTDFFPSKN